MDFDIKPLRDAIVADTEAKTLDLTPPASGSGLVAVVPEGKKLVDLSDHLDRYLEKPRRRKGEARHQTIESFLAHTNRFKAENSVLFGHVASETEASLTAIFDYHPEGPDHADAANREHRGIYPFPFSDEWKLWLKNDETPMTQNDFAAFIEDHIGDVAWPYGEGGTPSDAEPLGILAKGLADNPLIGDAMMRLGGILATPSKLVELSRGLAVNSAAKVKNAQNLQSGEVQVQFEVEHQGADGKPIKVPSFFILNIPIFNRGKAVAVLARLRYRLAGGAIVWFYQLYRPDLIVRGEVDATCADAAEKTGLPLFMGRPE